MTFEACNDSRILRHEHSEGEVPADCIERAMADAAEHVLLFFG